MKLQYWLFYWCLDWIHSNCISVQSWCLWCTLQFLRLYLLQNRQYTATVTHSRSICILWYDLRVLWPAKSIIKSYAIPLASRLYTDMNWIFNWGTVQLFWSRGIKVTSLQSWQSKMSWDILGSRLRFIYWCTGEYSR